MEQQAQLADRMHIQSPWSKMQRQPRHPEQHNVPDYASQERNTSVMPMKFNAAQPGHIHYVSGIAELQHDKTLFDVRQKPSLLPYLGRNTRCSLSVWQVYSTLHLFLSTFANTRHLMKTRGLEEGKVEGPRGLTGGEGRSNSIYEPRQKRFSQDHFTSLHFTLHEDHFTSLDPRIFSLHISKSNKITQQSRRKTALASRPYLQYLAQQMTLSLSF
ncbi:hypothetical protein EDD37DRAFT_354656 [Exophiala viscosa]|uniref:uncharacterized protein n=1 Tax=Exophiala viscosa TaxID=2486360 RepID=UPI0021976162|nr:hypothetical protein EDD37DRAFT_354656 [Exophiala viscosa]